MNVLTYPIQEQITRALIAHELQVQSAHLARSVEADPEVVSFLIGKGFSPDLGARNIRNCVERYVGDALRPYVLTGRPASRPLNRRDGADYASVGDRWSDALVLSVGDDALLAGPIPRSGSLQRVLVAVGPAAELRLQKIEKRADTGRWLRMPTVPTALAADS